MANHSNVKKKKKKKLCSFQLSCKPQTSNQKEQEPDPNADLTMRRVLQQEEPMRRVLQQ